MTYRSDTLAFKKSELLEVLQAINSNFRFEDNDSSEKNNTDYSKPENIIEDVPSHLKTLILSDYFSIVEAACCISQDEATKIQALLDSGDLNYDAWRYGEHIQAVKVIENGIKANKLEVDSEGQIPRRSLQYFLHERGYILSGFNDKLPEQELIECGTPSIKQTLPNTENLSAEITRLRAVVMDKTRTIEDLQDRITQLETEQESTQSEIQTSEQDSKLSTREENNIIRVLAVLAELERKIDISKPYEAHGIMAQKAQFLGVDPFPSNESIKKWFLKATEYKNPN